MPWINCKEVADDIMKEARELIDGSETRPTLSIISVGNDPASEVYVRNKVRACADLGIDCIVHHASSDIDQIRLEAMVNYYSDADGAVILQLPIPKHLNVDNVIAEIHPSKDVDGLGKHALVTPCTPLGIMRILHNTYLGGLGGLNAVIVGRSDLVGKPLAKLLTDEDCTVTLCHSRTRDLKMHTLNAEIVVVAAGVPYLLTPDMVRDNTIVIDVGINRVDGKLVGDVDPRVAEKAYVTPVPGGVGKTTVASLMLNLAYLNEKRFR